MMLQFSHNLSVISYMVNHHWLIRLVEALAQSKIMKAGLQVKLDFNLPQHYFSSIRNS